MVKGIQVGEECWVCNAVTRDLSALLRVGKAILRSEEKYGFADCQLIGVNEHLGFAVEYEIFKTLEEIVERYGDNYIYYDGTLKTNNK